LNRIYIQPSFKKVQRSFGRILLEICGAVKWRQEKVLSGGGSAFILAHWNERQNRKDPDSIGSCTEALVGHVLSERFSRNPMEWSKSGPATRAMIRVFVKNGGMIMPADIGAKQHSGEERRTIHGRIAKYAQLARSKELELLRDCKN
jgi:hypothetical protein